MLFIDGFFMFLSYSPENQWMTMTEWLSFLCWDPVYEIFGLYLSFDSIAQWYMCCFNHLLDLKYWFHISGLVKFICERSLSRNKGQFLSEVVFVVTLRLPSTTLGTFGVLTNWCCCWGQKCKSALGGTTKVYKD